MVKIINIDTKTRTIRISNADGDIKTWRTTESGTHFPIREGETTKEALDKFVEKKRPGSTAKPEESEEIKKAKEQVKYWRKQYKGLQGRGMSTVMLRDAEETLKKLKKAEKEKAKTDFSKPMDLVEATKYKINPNEDFWDGKGQTIGEMEKAGKDVSALKHEMTRLHYGFYDEKGKNMTPQELLEYMKKRNAEAQDEKTASDTRVKGLLPDGIKNVQKYIDGDQAKPAKDDVHSRVEKAQRVEAETGVAPEDWEAYENARESGAYNMFDYNAISEDTGLPKELIRKIQENYSTLRDAYGTPDGDDDDDEPAPQPKQGSQPSTADDPRKDGDDAETRAEALWDKYVPDTGPAETLFGEMLRAAGRVKYRYYNDGDMYGNGYGKETVNNAISYLGKLAGGQDTEFKKELSRAVYQATSAASRYDEEEYKRQVDRIVGAFANASWDDIKALADIKNETDSLTEYPDDTSYDDDDEEDY